jgi:hypothetical protein
MQLGRHGWDIHAVSSCGRQGPLGRRARITSHGSLTGAQEHQEPGLSQGTHRRALPGRANDEGAHVTRMLAKLGLRDRVQAVVFAYESGLTEPGRG